MRQPMLTSSPYGKPRQSSIVSAHNDPIKMWVDGCPMHGIIANVYTIDSTSENRGIPYGVFTLYDVRLSPTGQIIRNVPAMGFGGHFSSSTTFAWDNLPNYSVTPNVSKPTDSMQNVEETPYVINQPVILMFLGNNENNPIIIGPAPCADSGVGQRTSEYPKKYGSFQGASWSIDKNGAAEIDFPLTQSLTIKVGGNVLCYIKDGEIDLGGPNGDPDLEPTVLGTTLSTYLNTTLNNWLSLHTHTCAGAGSPSSTPINNPPPTASGIETSVAKVK